MLRKWRGWVGLPSGCSGRNTLLLSTRYPHVAPGLHAQTMRGARIARSAAAVATRRTSCQAALVDKSEDAQLRMLALEQLDQIMDASRELPIRSQLRNLAIPARTPHLVDLQKGIWNPSWLLATLSVATVLGGRYEDKELGDGLWEYRYREGGSEGDNRKLQRAADLEVDVVYFREETPGHYRPHYPVRVIQNDPIEQRVLLARKDLEKINWTNDDASITTSLRSWATREVKIRRHQRRFRELVLDAYATRCAVCELPLATLLDAAHIDPDSSTEGEPLIENGLALCKLHHYAYDSNVIGITAGRRIHVAPRVLQMAGSAMLEDGLKAFHKRQLVVPARASLQPAQPRLARRWLEFRMTATDTVQRP